MKKVALLKIGMNFGPFTKPLHVSGGEVQSIIKLLTDQSIEVDVFGQYDLDQRIYDGKTILRRFRSYEDVDSDYYDALIVLNGPCNFMYLPLDNKFENILNYQVINNFNGPIYFFLCDVALQLKQIWDSVKNSKYSEYFEKEQIVITREDIICLTQAKKTFELENEIKSNGIKFKEIRYFPFQKFPLVVFPEREFNITNKFVDVMYGGSFRKDREDDLIKFFFGYPNDISIELFGSINLAAFNDEKIGDLNLPKFTNRVSYEKFNSKMKTALSTVVIGDELYKRVGSIAQRVYESIQAGNLVFIDKSYDPDMRVFNHPTLRKFCYVNDSYDITKRIRLLRQNENAISNLIKLQRDNAKIANSIYRNQLFETMNGFVHISANDVEEIKEFTLSHVDQWEEIRYQKRCYTTGALIESNRFAGFQFTDIDDAKYYFNECYKYLQYVFTPPRGNLRRDGTHVFIGIKPGSYYAHQSKAESAWLLGPSSKILHRLLDHLGIFPYFTNVYKFHKDEENGNIVHILNELKTILRINPNIILVFMGRYPEYDDIIIRLRKDFGDSIFRKIWHPAYILRSYSESKFYDWTLQV